MPHVTKHRVLAVSRSAGGQLFDLADNNARVSRLLAVRAQNGYWRHSRGMPRAHRRDLARSDARGCGDVGSLPVRTNRHKRERLSQRGQPMALLVSTPGLSGRRGRATVA